MDITAYTKEVILQDIKKLQDLYELKKVIRSNLKRSAADCSESVAEHVYSMHILALYFLPLEDPDNRFDRELVFRLITTHDLEEVVTGDVIGWNKTATDRQEEAAARERIISESPKHLQTELENLFAIYDAQTLPEAKFVKAIDKLDPHVHFFREEFKWIFQENKITAERAMSIKEPYTKAFPFIHACSQVLHEQMLKQAYYYQES